MGYYSYQNGLIYRNLNQDGGWDEHNQRCRNYILKAVDRFAPSKVTVLGSGWLLDIPLAEIAEKAVHVDLIDIVHPPQVREQTSVYKNVHLCELDVTGGLISEIWDKTRKYYFLRKLKTLEQITLLDFVPAEDPGLVISLNILTQLENLPVEYLKSKSVIQESEFINFRKLIQSRHLDFLRQHKSVLITDVEEIFTGNNGQSNVVPTLRIDIPDGAMKEEWTWNFDLQGSDYYNRRSILKVMAATFDHEQR